MHIFIFKFLINLGDFEIFINYISGIILGFIIYNIINLYSFRNLLKRFGFLKENRKDFYECGFKPQNQKTLKFSMQFFLICLFFILYDIELIFLFPYVSSIVFVGFYDLLLFIFFLFIFFVSLIIDYEKHALNWQF